MVLCMMLFLKLLLIERYCNTNNYILCPYIFCLIPAPSLSVFAVLECVCVSATFFMVLCSCVTLLMHSLFKRIWFVYVYFPTYLWVCLFQYVGVCLLVCVQYMCMCLCHLFQIVRIVDFWQPCLREILEVLLPLCL